jgi:hypothetical protein
MIRMMISFFIMRILKIVIKNINNINNNLIMHHNNNRHSHQLKIRYSYQHNPIFIIKIIVLIKKILIL